MGDSGTIIKIAFLLPLALAIAVKFVFLTRREIIDVHETNVRVVGLVSIIVIFTILSSYSSYKAWLGYRELGVLRLPLILLFLYPILNIVHSYFKIPKYFKEKYQLLPIHERKGSVEERISYLSARIGLESPPSVMVSAVQNISPFVFGWFKKPYLVLPSNFDELIDLVSDSEEDRSFCRDFILMHELSHVKNGDFLLVGWIMCLSRSFKYWLPLLVLVPIPYFFLASADLIMFYSVYVYWVCCLFVSTYFLFTSFLRYRELLADSRSFVYVPKSERTAESAIYKMVEKLLVSCEVFLRGWLTEGSGFLSTLPELRVVKALKVGTLFSVHPRMKARIGHLRNKRYVVNFEEPERFGVAIWIGATFSFASLAIFIIGVGTSLSVMQIGAFLLTIYHSLQVTSRLRNSMSYFSLREVPKILKGLAVTYAYALASAVVFLLALASVPGLVAKTGLPVWIMFSYCLLIHLVSFIFSILIIMLLQFSFYQRFLFGSEMWNNLKYMGLFLIAHITIFVCVAFMIGVTAESILIGLLLGLCVTVIVMPLLVRMHGNVVDRWYCYDIGFLKICLEGRDFIRYGWVALSVVFLIVLTGPCIVFANLIGWVFRAIDPRDARYIYLGLAGVLFLTVFLSQIISFRIRVSKVEPILKLRLLRWGAEINRRIGRQLGENERERLKRFLQDSYLKGQGVDNWGFKIIVSEYFFHLVSIYRNLDIPLVREAGMLRLIESCENPAGGFGVWEGSSGKLRTTYFAIDTFKILDKLDRLDARKHVNWIKYCQTDDGWFRSPYSSRGKLEETFYALQALKVLGAIDEIDKPKCMQWLRESYERAGKGIEETYCRLGCMECLGILDDETKHQVENTWISAFEPLVYQLRFDKNYLHYFYLLAIVECLFGRESSKMSSVIDRISQVVDKTSFFPALE